MLAQELPQLHALQYAETWYIGFLILYVWDWLRGMVKYKDGNTAYFNIRAEQEAYEYEFDKDYLEELIKAVQDSNATFEVSKPILLKIAPDLNETQLDEIIELVAETKIDGVIASNTSTTRDNLKVSKKRLQEIGNGGVSGQPIKNQSTKVIKYLADNSNKSFPIIGVGGIHSEKDALEKINAGADLVQIYTGFIYEGPSLVKRINKAILKDL